MWPSLRARAAATTAAYMCAHAVDKCSPGRVRAAADVPSYRTAQQPYWSQNVASVGQRTAIPESLQTSLPPAGLHRTSWSMDRSSSLLGGSMDEGRAEDAGGGCGRAGLGERRLQRAGRRARGQRVKLGGSGGVLHNSCL
jgi:hypothetical protein